MATNTLAIDILPSSIPKIWNRKMAVQGLDPVESNDFLDLVGFCECMEEAEGYEPLPVRPRLRLKKPTNTAFHVSWTASTNPTRDRVAEEKS